jgi:hypothetical protein
MWYNTPATARGWIEASQDHQAWATRFATEAFRPRRPHGELCHPPVHRRLARRLDENDHGRGPPAEKGLVRVPARADAPGRAASYGPLPLFRRRNNAPGSLGGERPQRGAARTQLRYQLEKDGKVVFAGRAAADIRPNDSRFQGFINLPVPK